MDDPSPSRVQQLASRFEPRVSKVQRMASMFERESPSPSAAVTLSRRVGGNSTAKIQFKRVQSDRSFQTDSSQQPVRRSEAPSPPTAAVPALRSDRIESLKPVPGAEESSGKISEKDGGRDGERGGGEDWTEGLEGMSVEEMEALWEIMALEEAGSRAERMEKLGYEVCVGDGREEYKKDGGNGEGGWWQVGYSDGRPGGVGGGGGGGGGNAEGAGLGGGKGIEREGAVGEERDTSEDVFVAESREPADNSETSSVLSVIQNIEGLSQQGQQQQNEASSPEGTPRKSRKDKGGKKSKGKRKGESGSVETVAGAVERFNSNGRDAGGTSASRMHPSTSAPSLALAAANASGATAGIRSRGMTDGSPSPLDERRLGMANAGAGRGAEGMSGEFGLGLTSSPSLSTVDAELLRRKSELARYETELARRRAELNRVRVDLATVGVEKVQAEIALTRLKQEIEDWSFTPQDGSGVGGGEEEDEAGKRLDDGCLVVKRDRDAGTGEEGSSPGRLKGQLGKARLDNERLKRREKSLTADVEYIETMLAQEKGESAGLRRELAEVKQQRKDFDRELAAARAELSTLRRSAAVAERRAAAEEADAALLRQQLQKAQAAEMGLLEQLQLATKESMGLRKTLVWSKETREDAEEWEREMQGSLKEQVQRNGELEVKGGEMMAKLMALEKELGEEQQRRTTAEFQAREAVAAKALLEEEVVLLRRTSDEMRDAWLQAEGGEGRRAASKADDEMPANGSATGGGGKVVPSDGLKLEVPIRVWDILEQVEETKAKGMAERDELTRLHWLTACLRGELHKARFAAIRAADSTTSAAASAAATPTSSPAPALVPPASVGKSMGKAVSKKLSLVLDLDQHASAAAAAPVPDAPASTRAGAASTTGASTTSATPRTPPHSTTSTSSATAAAGGSKFARWFSHRSDRPSHSSSSSVSFAAGEATGNRAAAGGGGGAGEGGISPVARALVPRVATDDSVGFSAASAPTTPAPAAAPAAPSAAAATATTPSGRKHHLLSFKRMTSHK